MAFTHHIPANAFCWKITVQPDDIDDAGHASNLCTLRWMNQAAVAHSRSLGWDVPQYQQVGGWFIVRRHEIDYVHPSFAGDELHCHTWPSSLVKTRAERQHRIVRPSDGKIIARGINHWVYVDMQTGKPRRMPAEVAAAFDPAKFV